MHAPFLLTGDKSRYSVFDSQLFLQQPAAVLSSLEAMVRCQACNNVANEQPTVAWATFAQTLRSTVTADGRLRKWIMKEAGVAQSAADGGSQARQASSNCSSLLSLLVTCTKSQLAYVQHVQPSTTMQLAGSVNLLMLSFQASRLQVCMSGMLHKCSPGEQHKQQHLLDGFTHLNGRALVGADRLLAGALHEPARLDPWIDGTGPSELLVFGRGLQQMLDVLTSLLEVTLEDSELPYLGTLPGRELQELVQ